MKWPRVVESWMYRDPAEHADALIARSQRQERRQQQGSSSTDRDRYYTAARRIEVRRAMKGQK